jgi:16S rRNA (guanine966-N2)-methyltransferase
MKRGVRELRIIAGSHRGRRWTFPEVPGLRPTPDRVRETLFNWLAAHVAGARVLDLFAGSGALGFEALSRGAAAATLVESNAQAAQQLRATATQFGFAPARIEAMDALTYLRQAPAQTVDLLFVDPPFDSALMAPALKLAGDRRLLASGGFCYLEQPAASALPPLPERWVTHRSGKAGEVGYYLLHEPPRDVSRNL